ncbi:MAG: fumarylacetoacetate hydrolase family protein [Dehalococcoidia bacterium]|nr:fumarylacetoacetate hydrolase family protein [Dehalococcoidia bacterium]
MKLVMFNDFVPGVLDGNRVVDISSAVSDIPHMSPQELMSGIIANFDSLKGSIEALVSSSDGVDRSDVRLRSPLPKPTQIVAMAANYMEHGAREAPAPINAFLKSSNSIIGDGDTLVLPDAPAAIFHHEAELGVVIGTEVKNVDAADAYQYIFGYVNFIDGSARGVGGNSFFQGKSWDTFGPVGPCLVTADEVDDPQNVNVRLWVNGRLRQDFSTSDMAYNIARCIEWASGITTLEPGDILATGTNHQGLGAMQDGDVIEMHIDGLDKLTINVRDDLKREWPREIDQATADFAAGRTTSGGFGRS